MASIDMCEHDWPGTGCRECMREVHKIKISELEERLLDQVESRMLAEAELHTTAELSLKAEARIEELEELLREVFTDSSFRCLFEELQTKIEGAI